MKFKLVDKYRYWWPVTVTVPNPEKAGDVITQAFEIEFQAQTQSEANAMQAFYDALPSAAERNLHEHDQLRDVVQNWRGIEAKDGGDKTFSAEAFEMAMQHTWFRLGVYKAYRESLFAEAARLGN